MPDNYGRDFTITVTFSPDQALALVTLAGDLDIDAWPELIEAIHHLAATPPAIVDVDVDALGHVGAVLPNFLVQVRQAVPARSLLTVSHPSIMARIVLALTHMIDIADIDGVLAA